MPDGLVDGVNDRLSIGPDIIYAFIEIENPSERLLGRSDIVALRAEHHDGGTDVAQVDHGPVRRLYPAGREIVADEELIHNELNLLRIKIDVASPPALEPEIARSLGVDLGVEVVLLGPERV